MIIKRTIEGRNYEINTEEHEPYMSMNIVELACELLDNYDEEVIAYSVGASLFKMACG